MSVPGPMDVLRAFSSFTVVDGMIVFGWFAWMLREVCRIAGAYLTAGQQTLHLQGVAMALVLMLTGLLALTLGMWLEHGTGPIAWGMSAALCWLLGWMNLDRWRRTGKPWI